MTSTIGMDPYFLATQTQMPYDAYSQYYAQLLAGAQQNQGTQQSQGAQLGTSNLTFQGTQPQVKRAAQEEKSAAGTALTLGTIATLGAVAFFGHRSGKNLLKDANFFETTWAGIKSWFPKFGKEVGESTNDVNKICKLISKENKGLQEYTIIKDGVKIEMKDGKAQKIITTNMEEITDSKEISKWLKKNKISKDITLNKGMLPDDVAIRYERTIDGRKYVIENGEIVEIWKREANGKSQKLPKSQWEDFMNKRTEDIEQATSLTKKLSGKSTGITGEIKVTKYKDGRLKYFVGDKEATSDQIKNISTKYKKEIENIGKENLDNYDGISKFTYVRKVGEDRIIYDKDLKPTTVEKLNDIEVIGSTDKINKYLEENKLNDEIKSITDGVMPDGWYLGNVTVKTNAGVCKISKNGKKLETLKLNKEFKHGDKVYKADEEISGDVLEAWQKENKDEYDKILELLK